jgi:hypothetical protein
MTQRIPLHVNFGRRDTALLEKELLVRGRLGKIFQRQAGTEEKTSLCG